MVYTVINSSNMSSKDPSVFYLKILKKYAYFEKICLDKAAIYLVI